MAFIKLDRKYFENFLWSEERTYSKAEAWLDLIQSARFEAKTEIVSNKVIELQRGELPASNRFLQLRWKWSNNKVSNFVKILVQQGMITTKSDNGITIIKLCKYDRYNTSENEQSDTDATPMRHQCDTDATPMRRQSDEIKELKNEKELKKDIEGEKQFSPHTLDNSQNLDLEQTNPAKHQNQLSKKVAKKKVSIKQRAENFRDEIWEEVKDSERANQKEELRKFFEYWSEHGKNDRKMRFEKERSFSLKRRLNTWFDNAEKFKTKPISRKFKNDSVKVYSDKIE